MGNEGISVADAIALSGRNYGNSGNSGFGGWGGDGGWWIILLVILFANGGWGRNGNGGYGSNFGGGAVPYINYNPCCAPATAQGVTDAFNFNQLDNGVRGLERGICDGFYGVNNSINSVLSAIQNCCCDTRLGMCQGFNGVNQSIANLGYQMGQGFCGVDKTIMNSDFHTQSGFNALTSQLAASACDLGRGQENIKYALAQSTNDIIIANDKNTDRIINYLTQTEMEKLRTELQSAQFQLSQLSQTSNIVNQLMPVAKPAYLTCSPYAAMMGYPYGYSNNCGCGCNACA